MDDPRQRHRRRKKELLDPSFGRETQAGELTALQIQGKQQNKIPGIVFKGMFLAMAMTLLPFFPSQAPQFIKYANARGFELINLFLVGLAVSYGVLSRRPGKETEQARDDNLGLRGTEKYVSKMFEFGGVFDDFESVNDDGSPMSLPSPAPAIDGIFDGMENGLPQEDRSETWNLSWRPEEALTHIVGAENGTAVSENAEKKRFVEKPLLLPIRSLKSSLSNPNVFDFLYETEKSEDSSSKPEGSVAVMRAVHNWNSSKSEVRNGELYSVESGNLEQNLDNIIGNDEAVVFPSPIPWSSRSERLDTKESQPACQSPPVENLSLNDRKLELHDAPAVPSPIPWSSRPDASDIPVTVEGRPSNDGRQKKNMAEKSDSKPPLPHPASPVQVENRTNEKNLSAIAQQLRSEKPVQKAPTPRPSPCPTPRSSPPRSHPTVAENGSAQKTEIKQRNSNESGNLRQDNSLHGLSASPRPSPSPSPRPSLSPPRPRPTAVATGSADLKHRDGNESSHVRKDDLAHKTSKEAPVVAAQDSQSGKSERKVPTPSIPNPSHCPVVGINGSSEKNGSTEKKSSNHRNDDGSRSKNVKDVVDSITLNPQSEGKHRKVPSPPPAPPPPPPPPPPSVVQGLLSHNEKSEVDLSHGNELRCRSRDGSSRLSHMRHGSRDGSSHSRHNSTDVEAHSSVSKHRSQDVDSVERRSRDVEAAPRLQSENIGKKAPSPPPPVPPPPPPVLSDVPSSGLFPPPPPPPPFPMDEEHLHYAYDALSHQQEINSSGVVVESVDSRPEIEEDIVPNHDDTHFGSSPDEVDQKADAFIAKFHEQIRLQRIESIRHYEERLDRGHRLT